MTLSPGLCLQGIPTIFLSFLFPLLVEISYADRLKNRHPSHMTGKYRSFFLLSIVLSISS
jgi:hypothetical protein